MSIPFHPHPHSRFSSASTFPPPFYPSREDEITSDTLQSQPQSPQADINKKQKSSSSTTTTKSKNNSRSTSKTHFCPTCSASFSRLFNLNQHVLIHSNKREFNCLESGCTKTFLRSTDLTRHCKHVHRIETKKDRRYSNQKKELSIKSKEDKEKVINISHYPPPTPQSPSSFSSTSSENTNSTQASSFSSHSNSQLDQHHSQISTKPTFNHAVQFSFSRNSVPGEQLQHSDTESIELNMREEHHEKLIDSNPSNRTVQQEDFTLPPIKSTLAAISQSQGSAPPRPIMLPPLNLAHPPLSLSANNGPSPSFPSHLGGPSPSPPISSRNHPISANPIKMESQRPLTPALPSTRSQLPFSFSNSFNSNPNSYLSNSRTPMFESTDPLPPIRTYSSSSM